mmetsp:Transcript_12841/g.36932  ORF Transcript_12841/g.36932 Transcript_12841/m.36932 type:complete len:165 (-) Transcript_12841:313-807(-)
MPGSCPKHLEKTEMCKFFRRGRCKYGRACTFAHSDDELRPIPSRNRAWPRAAATGRWPAGGGRQPHGVPGQEEGSDRRHGMAEAANTEQSRSQQQLMESRSQWKQEQQSVRQPHLYPGPGSEEPPPLPYRLLRMVTNSAGFFADQTGEGGAQDRSISSAVAWSL